jgi:hypothetical protein
MSEQNLLVSAGSVPAGGALAPNNISTTVECQGPFSVQLTCFKSHI